jgi:VIT1/CCC1 family predicted Fe2+/Mn2+ transporter
VKTPQREYLRSTLFGIENSVISTAGLIAGISVGTKDNHVVALGATVAIVIEAVAMGVGEYLSDDAVQELDKLKRHQDNPARSGALMMIAGTLAGLVPLLPVLFLDYPASLICSVLAAFLVLFMVGFVKSKVLHSSPIRGGVKTLVVGGIATLLGVIVGLMFRQ